MGRKKKKKTSKKKPNNKKSLKDRRQRFIQEYLLNPNATQAAIKAGYSEKTAKQIGHNLLTSIDVREEIEKENRKRAKRYEITADNVLREIARIAFSDKLDYSSWDENGVGLRPSRELTEDQSRAIRKISEKYDASGRRILSVELYDKDAALEKLNKHLKLYDDNKLHVTLDWADVLDRARAKKEELEASKKKETIEGEIPDEDL